MIWQWCWNCKRWAPNQGNLAHYVPKEMHVFVMAVETSFFKDGKLMGQWSFSALMFDSLWIEWMEFGIVSHFLCGGKCVCLSSSPGRHRHIMTHHYRRNQNMYAVKIRKPLMPCHRRRKIEARKRNTWHSANGTAHGNHRPSGEVLCSGIQPAWTERLAL